MSTAGSWKMALVFCDCDQRGVRSQMVMLHSIALVIAFWHLKLYALHCFFFDTQPAWLLHSPLDELGGIKNTSLHWEWTSPWNKHRCIETTSQHVKWSDRHVYTYNIYIGQIYIYIYIYTYLSAQKPAGQIRQRNPHARLIYIYIYHMNPNIICIHQHITYLSPTQRRKNIRQTSFLLAKNFKLKTRAIAIWKIQTLGTNCHTLLFPQQSGGMQEDPVFEQREG